MTGPALAILARLRRLGVEIRADGDRLRFRPRDRVDDDLIRGLVEHKAALLTALTAMPDGSAIATGGKRFDRDDVSQADDLNIVRQRVVRLGVEDVKGKLGDEAKAGVTNVQRPAVGEADPQGNERVAVQFVGEGLGGHTPIVPFGDDVSYSVALDALDRRVIEAIDAGETIRLTAADLTAIAEWNR